MNVNDFKAELSDVPCKLNDIFIRQALLKVKYDKIEEANGFPKSPVPLNLHLAREQLEVKDMAWRVTEELGEAYEAYIHLSEGKSEAKVHLVEELSDALHFMVELCICVDIGPMDLGPGNLQGDRLELIVADGASGVIPEMDDVSSFFFPIYHLTLACNCLKNKPWKSSMMMTDVDYFRKHIVAAFHSLIDTFLYFELDANQIYDIYLRKNSVNQFRQATNY